MQYFIHKQTYKPLAWCCVPHEMYRALITKLLSIKGTEKSNESNHNNHVDGGVVAEIYFHHRFCYCKPVSVCSGCSMVPHRLLLTMGVHHHHHMHDIAEIRLLLNLLIPTANSNISKTTSGERLNKDLPEV